MLTPLRFKTQFLSDVAYRFLKVARLGEADPASWLVRMQPFRNMNNTHNVESQQMSKQFKPRDLVILISTDVWHFI